MDMLTIRDVTKYMPKFDYKHGINCGEMSLKKRVASAYNGAGLCFCNQELMQNRNNIYKGYDINSAYQSVQLKELFPYGEIAYYPIENSTFHDDEIDRFIKQEYGNHQLYFVYIRVQNMRPKNINFDILGYINTMEYDNDNDCTCGYVTNIDFGIIRDLYNYDDLIIDSFYLFQGQQELPNEYKDLLNNRYNLIHSMQKGNERSETKKNLNMMTYGKLAQKRADENGLYDIGIEYSGRFYGLRSPYVPIAMYISAYVRRRLANIYLKYGDKIVYTDTDSCYVLADTEFNESISNNIGDWKLEQDSCYIDFMRTKGYIVYNLDRSIREQKISGIPTDEYPMTQEEINSVMNGKPVLHYCVIDNEPRQITIARHFGSFDNLSI